ncbi:methylmalonyl-CoA mutase subunit beta [Salinimicrobium sp. TH3]|uniref:methylmalonyl-CoA mutase subunit beta n=1 Tax=Salinimicrobium sp. TH3 TaxID=2997342 RepID=UPI0022750E83|nr:methylmalonyl-CoA mutase subunit beta [Salinimicrobium sp. TH3]MCY2686431.1 methylmalonyl-CoA mutase subunit beta [Salinimicrobium sp. TH3]
MKEQLFQEFPEVSAEQWKNQVIADLKGADYDKSLIFDSPHGVKVKPFYTSEDIKGSIQLPPPKPWSICEQIIAETAGEANRKAAYALEKGAESIWLVITNEDITPEALLEGLDLEKVRIFISMQFLSGDYVENLNSFLAGKKNKVHLQIDIFGNLARTGNYFLGKEEDITTLNSLFFETSGFKSVVSVDAALYQNAGATIPQQLGYALSHLNEYLNILSQKGQISEGFLPQFILATGGNYFFEIAKIRALRWLYATLAKKYNLPGECMILSQPTKRDKTLYDYNVNLLRTTTQSMSAILGGANVVYNHPYDVIFHKSNEFGERIARNQLLVMKHEAYLNKAANASDGAYYIETLTREFAEAGLQIFREVEKEGGFLKLLKQGIIQEKIERSAEKEQQLFDDGELILIGTNKFTNLQENMGQDLELDPFKKTTLANMEIEPIVEKRLSEKQEQERLQKEQSEITQS